MAERPGRNPTPTPAERPSPATSSSSATNAEGATSSTSTGGTDELLQLRSELAKMKEAEKARGLTLRKIAAALLTPPDAGDKGRGRKETIRTNLLALVDAIAPDVSEHE